MANLNKFWEYFEGTYGTFNDYDKWRRLSDGKGNYIHPYDPYLPAHLETSLPNANEWQWHYELYPTHSTPLIDVLQTLSYGWYPRPGSKAVRPQVKENWSGGLPLYYPTSDRVHFRQVTLNTDAVAFDRMIRKPCPVDAVSLAIISLDDTDTPSIVSKPNLPVAFELHDLLLHEEEVLYGEDDSTTEEGYFSSISTGSVIFVRGESVEIYAFPTNWSKLIGQAYQELMTAAEKPRSRRRAPASRESVQSLYEFDKTMNERLREMMCVHGHQQILSSFWEATKLRSGRTPGYYHLEELQEMIRRVGARLVEMRLLCIINCFFHGLSWVD